MMHFLETEQQALDYAKDVLFSIVPESIKIFDRDDVAYIIFAEYADFLIKNIDNPKNITKAIIILDELLLKENETIETLIVLQVFEKFFISEDLYLKFKNFLSNKTLEIYNDSYVAYFE